MSVYEGEEIVLHDKLYTIIFINGNELSISIKSRSGIKRYETMSIERWKDMFSKHDSVQVGLIKILESKSYEINSIKGNELTIHVTDQSGRIRIGTMTKEQWKDMFSKHDNVQVGLIKILENKSYEINSIKGNELTIHVTSPSGAVQIGTMTREQWKDMFSKSNYVGLHNISLSCWINSLLQAIYACKPLLQKILSFNCDHPLFNELKKALRLLDNRDGSILELRELRNLIRTIFVRIKLVGDTGDPLELLMDLHQFFIENCGMQYDFFNLWNVSPSSDTHIAVLSNHGECLQNVITKNQEICLNLKQDARFIIIRTTLIMDSVDTGQDGVRNTLPHNGIITINSIKFKISAIIIRAPRHWYTITTYGRFDDNTITEDENIMNNFIEFGVDNSFNGYLYFFERVDDSFETVVLPPLPKIRQQFMSPPNSGSEATLELGLGFQDVAQARLSLYIQNINTKIESIRQELQKYVIEDTKLRSNQQTNNELFELNTQLIQLVDLSDIENLSDRERYLLLRADALKKNSQITIKQKEIRDILSKNKEMQLVLNKQLEDYLKIIKQYE